MRAGFHGIFALGRLNRSSLANLCCKPLPGEISVQNIPHGPVYLAGFAGYITLGIAITTATGARMLYRPEPVHRRNVNGVLLPLTAAIYLVFGNRAQDRGRPIGAFYPQHVSAATWEHLGGIWYSAKDEQKVQARRINQAVVQAFAASILSGQPVLLASGTLVTWERIPTSDSAQLPPPLRGNA